ncbi:MAG: group 1 glycosyl transferase [candidate division TM6 bacterium GW2011_GWF2_38_10]|nr:MAG: group 1 glycosyl transferase [candidate division TM6 bacterium GW2011_GWF2_38_10]
MVRYFFISMVTIKGEAVVFIGQSLFLSIFFFILLNHINCFGRGIDIQEQDIWYSHNKSLLKPIKFFRGKDVINYRDDVPKVLNVCLSVLHGGIVTQKIALYEYLLAKRYPVFLLVPYGSMIKKELKRKKLPFFAGDFYKNKALFKKDFNLGNNFIPQYYYENIKKLCQKCSINILHGSKDFEYCLIKKISQELSIRSLAQYHSYKFFSADVFQDFDGIITSSPRVAAKIKNLKLCSIVDFVHPPHEERKFLEYVSSFSRKVFFKNFFNIDISSGYVISMVANGDKQYDLLLDLAYLLKYQYHIKINIIIAGFVDLIKKNKNLYSKITKLHLNDTIHFIGYTDLIPDLLYYSDINILTSRHEAFGIAILEAGLMKKPVVISKEADVAGILVKDQESGLLASSFSADEFAQKIKMYIEDPILCKNMSENLYQRVTTIFSNEEAIKKIENIYLQLGELKK